MKGKQQHPTFLDRAVAVDANGLKQARVKLFRVPRGAEPFAVRSPRGSSPFSPGCLLFVAGRSKKWLILVSVNAAALKTCIFAFSCFACFTYTR